MDESLIRRVTSSTYHHVDNEYFRIARCLNCDKETFHKPLVFQRGSGRSYTIWKCEHCHVESDILHPVANEMEIFIKYVRARYLGKEHQGDLPEPHLLKIVQLLKPT